MPRDLGLPAPLSIDVPDVCLVDVSACYGDTTCATRIFNPDDIISVIETTFDEDCVADYLDGSSSDFEASLCCSDLLSDNSCFSSAELLAVIACALEYSECSVDAGTCLDYSNGVLASDSVALVHFRRPRLSSPVL